MNINVKDKSQTICIPNTVVVPNDAAVDDEKVVLTIRLFNEQLNPVFDATADICIEIKDPDDDILRPLAEDYTDKDGTYKVFFVAPKTGSYTAHVLINGKCINTTGYKFSALGQYSYNKRKHSFRSSPRLISKMTSPHSTPRIKTDENSFRKFSPRSIHSQAMKTEDEAILKKVSPRSLHSQTTKTGVQSQRKAAMTITERKFLYEDINCISIAFDGAISHPSVTVAKDSLTISLKTTKEICGSSPRNTGTRRLRRYPGTLGTRCFRKPGLFYWEIIIRFKILLLIRRTVLFEIGLARNDVVDKSFTNDRNPFAWVISGSGCHICGKVCLLAWHNGQMLSHNTFSDRFPSSNFKMPSKLHYGFLLDSSKREWIIIDIHTGRIVAHFKNLIVSERQPLWPVFALYNPMQAQVSMEMLYGNDISGIPEHALDALTI